MQPASDASPPPQNIRAGIFWMLGTMFCFVTMDACAKTLLTNGHSVTQVVWGRYISQVVLLAVIFAPRLISLIRTDHVKVQLLRSVLLLLTTILFFGALSYIPMANASAVMLVSPLIVTALSVPLLKEKVGVRRWAGVAIGFAGAMLIIRPGADTLQLAALLPLGAAFLYALFQISTKFLSAAEDPLTTLVYSALVGGVVLSISVPFHWEPFTPKEWLILAGTGTFGSIGHFCLINAFRNAPASAVVPFTYTNLLWATGYGYILFGDIPDLHTVLGAVIISASGLYIFHREQRVKSA